MLMMVDAYEPIGVTTLRVTAFFMMPHLGVLSTVPKQAATDVSSSAAPYWRTGEPASRRLNQGRTGSDAPTTRSRCRMDARRGILLTFGDLKLFSLTRDRARAVTAAIETSGSRRRAGTIVHANGEGQGRR